MINYVAGFLLDTMNERVLLINKLKPDWQAGKLNAIGGKVEDGETPYDAMVREFQEETLLISRPGMWELFCVLSGHVDRRRDKPEFHASFFRASEDILRYQPSQPEDEVPEWVWVDDITRNRRACIPNLRWLVPMACSTNADDWPYTIEENSI